MVGTVIAGMLGRAIGIGRDEAARAAREELSEQVYAQHEPGWLQRLLGWLTEQLARLFANAAGAVPGGWFGLLTLFALLVLAVVVIRWRLGPLARRRASGGDGPEVFGERRRSAREHREAAAAAAEAADWNTAVRESFRGLVADLTERTVLEDRAGRTADETARELADRAPEVTAAARLFDEVSYGDRTANQQAYATVRDADAVARRVRVE